MFIPDIGSTAGLLLGGAVAVAAAPVQATENYVVGMCQVSQAGSGADIVPAVVGDMYLYDYHSDLYNDHSSDPRYQGFTFDDSSVQITLVKAPAHGKIEHVDSTKSNNWYHYLPNDGYSGEDRFVMQVEKNGVKVQIQYLIKVPEVGESSDYLCSPEQIWKISSSTLDANGNPVLTLLAQPVSAAPDTLTSTSLTAWLSLAQLDAKVADMSGLMKSMGSDSIDRKSHIPETSLNEIRNATNKAWVLGNDRFKQRIQKQLERRVEPTAKGGDRKSEKFRINRV